MNALVGPARPLEDLEFEFEFEFEFAFEFAFEGATLEFGRAELKLRNGELVVRVLARGGWRYGPAFSSAQLVG